MCFRFMLPRVGSLRPLDTAAIIVTIIIVVVVVVVVVVAAVASIVVGAHGPIA